MTTATRQAMQSFYSACESQWLNKTRDDYKRGLSDGRRYSEFHVYEKRAKLNGGRFVNVAETSSEYFRGLADGGCKLR